MHDRSKLDESLVLDPTVGIKQTALEEVDALGDSRNIIVAEVLHHAGKVFDAHFTNAPNLIAVKLLERSFEHFLNENFVREMLRYSNQGRHCKLLYFEYHALLNVV